jgi:hypothetical protein
MAAGAGAEAAARAGAAFGAEGACGAAVVCCAASVSKVALTAKKVCRQEICISAFYRRADKACGIEWLLCF